MPAGVDNPALRTQPKQRRSRELVGRVLDVADELLASEGAAALSTNRIAESAGIAVGSVYRYFPDKEAIVEALAVRHWSELGELVAAVAEAEETSPSNDPIAAVIEALASGFRSRPSFLALWFGGLRTEAVRDITRPNRVAVAASIERILSAHSPTAPQETRATVARMVVIAGDGLLREAFRLTPRGDSLILAESIQMLGAYIRDRLEI